MNGGQSTVIFHNKVRNESKIVKREADQMARKAAAEAAEAMAAQQRHEPPQRIVTNEPPEHLVQELEVLKVS